MLLGLAELLVAAPVLALPPTLGFAVVCSGAAALLASGLLLLPLLRLGAVGRRHTDLVGAMLGPLVVAALVAPALRLGGGAWLALAWLSGGVVLLAAVAIAGAAALRRLGAARAVSAALVWGGASLVLAGIAWRLHGRRIDPAWPALAAIPLGAIVAGLGLRGGAPGRGRAPRTRFGGLLATLATAAAIAALSPWWLPWFFYDQGQASLGAWPPNVLVVALAPPRAGREGAPASESAMLGLLAVDAVRYPELDPEPRVESLLSLPDGGSIAARLYAGGYATAAIGLDPHSGRALGFPEIDDRPGGRLQLEDSAAWMAGAPLLLGPASPLLGLLGHDRPERSPEQIGGAAARWLLDWRTTRAPAPFCLFVDLRAPDADAAAIDAGLRPLLDRVDDLQLGALTLLVIAIESGDADAAGGSLRALIVPPVGWRVGAQRTVEPRVWSRALGQAVLEIVGSDGEEPVRLPGVDEEIAVPGAPDRSSRPRA